MKVTSYLLILCSLLSLNIYASSILEWSEGDGRATEYKFIADNDVDFNRKGHSTGILKRKKPEPESNNIFKITEYYAVINWGNPPDEKQTPISYRDLIDFESGSIQYKVFVKDPKISTGWEEINPDENIEVLNIPETEHTLLEIEPYDYEKETKQTHESSAMTPEEIKKRIPMLTGAINTRLARGEDISREVAEIQALQQLLNSNK